MLREKIKWNEKYKSMPKMPPSPLLDYIPSKNAKALDLAGGLGQNSEILIQKGYDVTLIDISETALKRITNPKIKKICLDLDTYIIPQNEWDIIIKIKYFNLNLLKQIPKALKNGGYFVFETIDKYPVDKKLFFELFKNFDIIYFNQKPFQFVGVKRGCN
ncbi:class I SAM-dependent methyltransferase [Caminibacter sp.]